MSGGRFMKLSYCSYALQAHMWHLCYQFCQIHWAILDTRENIPFARGMLAFWEGPEMSFRAAAYYSNIFHMQLGTRLLSLIQELQPTCSFQQKSMIGMRQQLWQTIPTCCGGCVGFPQLYLTLLRSPERFAGLTGLGINLLIFLTDTTWYTSLRYSSLMINLHKTKDQEGHFCHFQL